VLFNYSHDQQQTIMASQRPASRKGAFFPFTYKGVKLHLQPGDLDTEPANITFQAVPNGSPSARRPTRYSIKSVFSPERQLRQPVIHRDNGPRDTEGRRRVVPVQLRGPRWRTFTVPTRDSDS